MVLGGWGPALCLGGGGVGGRAMVGAGGGKAVSTPRGRSHHLLEGVGRPEEVHDLIISLMHSQR